MPRPKLADALAVASFHKVDALRVKHSQRQLNDRALYMCVGATRVCLWQQQHQRRADCVSAGGHVLRIQTHRETDRRVPTVGQSSNKSRAHRDNRATCVHDVRCATRARRQLCQRTLSRSCGVDCGVHYKLILRLPDTQTDRQNHTSKTVGSERARAHHIAAAQCLRCDAELRPNLLLWHIGQGVGIGRPGRCPHAARTISQNKDGHTDRQAYRGSNKRSVGSLMAGGRCGSKSEPSAAAAAVYLSRECILCSQTG